MAKLYSSENIDKILISNTGTNGDTLRTIAISRDNRFTDIYIKFKTSHLVRPTVYRGFYNDDGQLGYYETSYNNIVPTSDYQEIVFKYNMLNDENYINYFITFECLRTADTTIEMEDIGVQFEDIEGTLNNTKQYSTALSTDINKNPLTKQRYNATQGFSTINNRTDVQTILNVVDKPFYLIDELGEATGGVNVYGFDFDGNTYIENNNLDITQDLVIVMRILVPSTIQAMPILRSYSFDGISQDAQFNISFRSDGTLQFRVGDSTTSYPTVVFDYSNNLGEYIVFACRTSSNKVSIMYNNIITKNETEFNLDPIPLEPYYIGASNTYLGVDGYYEGVFAEYLEIQDTLTDAQLLEFSDLDKLNEHPDYATFNKNAYYDFDNQNTQDYSGNMNIGIVNGTEQYEIVETTPIIEPCIDNSTKKLILTSIGFNYITSATQMVSTNFKGIMEV